MLKIKHYRLSLFFFFFTFIGFCFSALATPAYADVGEVPMPGGIITSGDKVEGVEMAEENVAYDIKNANSDSVSCPFETYSDSCWYADVKAEFFMQNNGGESKIVDVFYPFPSMHAFWGGNTENWDALSAQDHSNNFVVKVNGQEVNYDLQELDYEYESQFSSGLSSLPSLTFEVEFAKDKETKIDITYQTKLVNEPKSHFGTFVYIMDTGSHWENKIGKGRLTFEFPNEISPNIFKDLDNRFNLSNQQIVWEFEDLEPSFQDNVNVTFSPDLLKIWNENQPSYDSVECVENCQKTSPRDLMENLDSPDGFMVPPSTSPIDSNLLFLIDTTNPGSEGYKSWAWFSEEDQKSVLKLEFNAVYLIESVEFFTGVPTYFMPTQGGDAKYFYDIYNRPKNIKLTFSDGSSQTLKLEDDPDNLMEVELDEKVETSSILVEFVDTYLGQGGKNKYMGLSRLRPVLGQKVREKEENTDEGSNGSGAGEESSESGEQGDDTSNGVGPEYSNKFIWIAAGLGGILFIGVIIVGIVLLRRNKKLQEKLTSKNADPNGDTTSNRKKTSDKKTKTSNKNTKSSKNEKSNKKVKSAEEVQTRNKTNKSDKNGKSK
jgi:hypothetical protein